MQLYAHGGVSGVARAARPSLTDAIERGRVAGDALDAVEATVATLEDHPDLNAGFGSVLDRDGGLTLDAGIADGARGSSGAVAAVWVRNPILLARRVLERTPHLLLAGSGAMKLADGMDVLTDTSDDQRTRWEEAQRTGKLDLTRYGEPDRVDTVGAVALDAAGRLAAGSSTGGVFGKFPGRVGDAPVFGAGFYASERAAVVGTGVGELFLATLACLRVGLSVEDGDDPQRACESMIRAVAATDLLTARRPSAGLLAIDRRGRVGCAARGGSWVVEGPDGPLDPVWIS